MLIGVPKEIKSFERRVGMTPASVQETVERGHSVIVQSGAGHSIGFDDVEYESAGAKITDKAEQVFENADMILKVKEPQEKEIDWLKPGQILFTYLHLAPDPEQTDSLLNSGCTAIAYETVSDDSGGLPLLAPMSAVAGRMAVQAGAHCLEVPRGGRGVLVGGVPGVPPATVVVLGGGVVGSNALSVAVGMGGKLTVIDKNVRRLTEIDSLYQNRVITRFSTQAVIAEELEHADLVIGAVLVPGAEAPKLISSEMVACMKRGAVIVDVAIDQGGCCESSRPTTHENPTYVTEGVVHYCVANMPGAVARTSTLALNNVTLPFVLKIADLGLKAALKTDQNLMNGLNIHEGLLTFEAIAKAQRRTFTPARDAIS